MTESSTKNTISKVLELKKTRMKVRILKGDNSKTIYNPFFKRTKFSNELINSKNAHLREKPFNGPISAKMWDKVNKLNSKYPDTFDWAIYDRIYNRFGEKQPRGGVVFKTTLKLVNYHPQCSKCHYTLELDTYGRGCIHNCVYCYAKDQLTLRGYWNRPHPMPVDLSELRKIFYTVFETNKKSKWREILEKRVPIRIGSMSDSFMYMDKKFKVTLELLKILNFYNYPYIIFTRSDLITHDEYLKNLNPCLASIQFSISGDNEAITRKLEPGAPSIKRRFLALKVLADAQIWTAIRINPLFPTFPDGYYSNSNQVIQRFGGRENIPKLDLLDISNCNLFFEQAAEAKAKTIIVGFVRLNQIGISQISKTLSINMKSFYNPDRFNPIGENQFCPEEVYEYYIRIAKQCALNDLRFSTCYIGNGIKDYYRFQNMWANKSDCCDSIKNIRGFTSSAQQIPWSVREKFSVCSNLSKASQQLEKKMDKTFKKNQNFIGKITELTNTKTSFGKTKWQQRTNLR